MGGGGGGGLFYGRRRGGGGGGGGGGGINTHEGRMLPHIYDEPLTGTNSPAFKFV